MEKIISSGSCSVEIKEEIVPETILSLQALLMIECCLGEKLPGTRFEAAKITCSRKKRRRIRKGLMSVHSWVRFLNLGEGEVLILTQSLKALGEEITPLTPKELVKELKGLEPKRRAQISSEGQPEKGAQGVSP